jgi:ArsR family transcriptional regulator
MEKLVDNIEKAGELANIFKALAHPIRVMMITSLIEKGECHVTCIVNDLKVSQPTISQHLNVLKTLGIVKGYRKGNQICYKLSNDVVKKIYDAIQ